MSDEAACKMYPPDGKRKHTFASVEREGTKMWVDLTMLRKAKSYDSVYVYRMEDGALVFDHYESAKSLHLQGVY